MKIKLEKHCRRSIRLESYDYTRSGTYFVTVCTQDRQCLFGDVVNNEMRLSKTGRMIVECWEWLAKQYEYVGLDEWAVMTNHLHGIIIINSDNSQVTPVGGLQITPEGGSRTAPTEPTKIKSLGRLIGAFKSVSTKKFNQFRTTSTPSLWQGNYYEHIIRNKNELGRVREYIFNNPLQWALDRENPAFVAGAEQDEPWLV